MDFIISGLVQLSNLIFDSLVAHQKLNWISVTLKLREFRVELKKNDEVISELRNRFEFIKWTRCLRIVSGIMSQDHTDRTKLNSKNSSVDCIFKYRAGDHYYTNPQIYSSSHSMTVYIRGLKIQIQISVAWLLTPLTVIFRSQSKVHLKQGDRVFVRLCPNSSEGYKTHSYEIIQNDEGKKFKRPRLADQIYTGKCSFFSGALVKLDGIDRTEEL